MGLSIETARQLLFAMISVLPVVISIFMISIFAFPRTKEGLVKDSKIYLMSMVLVIVPVIMSLFALILNFNSLIVVDKIIGIIDRELMIASLSLSFTVLIIAPIFALIYLVLLYCLVERKGFVY